MLRRLLVSGLLAFGVFMGASALLPSQAQAATMDGSNCTGQSNNFLAFPTWYKYLNPQWTGSECRIDIAIPESIIPILLAIFEILLRVAGIFAVIFVIYGGFQYLTSTGEPDKAKNARTTIINALVGMMIAIFSTAIINLIGQNIG